MSDVQIFSSVLVRDPYLFIGLLVMFVPLGIAHWRIYKCLRGAGFKYTSGLTLPAIWWEAHHREYAKTRAERGWPSWPIYAPWLGMVIGIPLLAVGIFKL